MLTALRTFAMHYGENTQHGLTSLLVPTWLVNQTQLLPGYCLDTGWILSQDKLNGCKLRQGCVDVILVQCFSR